VFNDNGSGVRGDLGAVIKAILLDDEARNAAGLTSPTFGKLREPVVRIANWARAFNATSHSGEWTIQDTSQPVALDQSVLNSPSVFNFWRPGYSPPGSAMGGQGLVAPEFQVVDAVTTAGYINLVQKMVGTGIGTPPAGSSIPDVTAAYGSETPLAANPAQLADRVNLMLLYGQMSPGLKTRIVSALNAIAFPKNATQTQIDGVLSNRAKMAVFMTLASPEYLAQR
jgi:ribose 5-phosphate isomerase RpiB